MGTPILVTEQGRRALLLLRPGVAWSEPEAVLWSWSYDDTTVDGTGIWDHCDDARPRRLPDGRRVVLTCASGGLLAIIAFPGGGRPLWQVDAGRDANPHGVELLPGGVLAATASHGGWVRVYATTGGAVGPADEQRLEGGHELWFDHDHSALWAVGDELLVRYRLVGRGEASTLRVEGEYDLPTPGGHDLGPVAGTSGRLWVTTVHGVYQFDPATGRFVHDFPRARELYARNIKSIRTDVGSGDVLQTTPQDDNPLDWATATVDVWPVEGPPRTLTLPRGQIYRARYAPLLAR